MTQQAICGNFVLLHPSCVSARMPPVLLAAGPRAGTHNAASVPRKTDGRTTTHTARRKGPNIRA